MILKEIRVFGYWSFSVMCTRPVEKWTGVQKVVGSSSTPGTNTFLPTLSGKCGYGGATVNVTLCNGWFTGWVLSVAGKCGNGGPTVNVTLCNGWFTGWVLSVAGKCGNGGPTVGVICCRKVW